MEFWHFVLFVLILRHVIPDTSATNYKINFQQENWIAAYSSQDTLEYLKKFQDLQLKLNFTFSNYSTKYNISILNLSQGPQRGSSNEYSIIASVNFTPDVSFPPSQINETLSTINAYLIDTTTSISTVSTVISSDKPTNNAINKLPESSPTTLSTGLHYSTYKETTFVNLKPGLDSSTSTQSTVSTSKSGLDSSISSGNTSSLAITLLATMSPNETSTTTFDTNNNSLITTPNMNTSLSDNSTSTSTNINSSIYTTPSSENVTGTVLGSTDNSTSSSYSTSTTMYINSTIYTTPSSENVTGGVFGSTDNSTSNSTSTNSNSSSSIESNSTQSSSPILDSTASTEGSTTLQSSTLSTTNMPTTISSTVIVDVIQNLTIRFDKENWLDIYSDLSNTVTKGRVLFYTVTIAKALNLEQAAVIIYSLARGSVLANTGIKSNTLNQTTINALLQGAGASIDIPSTATSTAAISTKPAEITTDSSLPTYAVALISVFTTCIIIAIIFVVTAVICRYRRLKGYGRHEVEFFEMNDGWKKSARNPSFQMD